MNENKRLLSALLCIILVVFTVWAGRENTIEEPVEELFDHDSLIVWYTDESMSDYINSMAVDYHEKYGMRVLPKLQSGDNYLESIYAASIDDDAAPDLYFLAGDALEKAYLSGCALNLDNEKSMNWEVFPSSAMNAVTYHDHPVAYPYYFETTALIYNKSYLYEMASNLVQAQNAKNPDDKPEDEEVEEKEVYTSEEEEIMARMQATIPKTFENLLTFADEFDAPPEVETIFKWDVRDIFFNYFFVGDYINIGGKNGDDPTSIDIYNMDAVKAFKLFQDMNQFFAFESADVKYKQVLEEFIQGKLVYATVTSDALAALKEATETGDFKYEYGVTMIPDLNDEMDTRSLSVTNTLVVNGYTDKLEDANRFARFLCVDNATSLYEKTGKLPAKNGVFDEDSPEYAFVQEYSYSVPMPKLMATSNCWLLMEGTFADIWSGKDVSTCLKELSEQIKLQIYGQEVEEEYIKYVEEVETIEYLDEDALKEAAQNEPEEE